MRIKDNLAVKILPSINILTIREEEDMENYKAQRIIRRYKISCILKKLYC